MEDGGETKELSVKTTVNVIHLSTHDKQARRNKAIRSIKACTFDNFQWITPRLRHSLKWYLKPTTDGTKVVVVGNGYHADVIHVLVVDYVTGELHKCLNLNGAPSARGRSFIRYCLCIREVRLQHDKTQACLRPLSFRSHSAANRSQYWLPRTDQWPSTSFTRL